MSTNVIHQFPPLFPDPSIAGPESPGGSPGLHSSCRLLLTLLPHSHTHQKCQWSSCGDSHCHFLSIPLPPVLPQACSDRAVILLAHSHPNPPSLLLPAQSFHRTALIISVPGSKPQVPPVSYRVRCKSSRLTLKPYPLPARSVLSPTGSGRTRAAPVAISEADWRVYFYVLCLSVPFTRIAPPHPVFIVKSYQCLKAQLKHHLPDDFLDYP